MSDFLITFDPDIRGADLLELLKQPYGAKSPKGQFFQFSWGAVAVLEDRIALGHNTVDLQWLKFAWVGDLVFPGGASRLRRSLETEVSAFGHEGGAESLTECLQRGKFLQELNGAFAAVFAGEKSVCVVTDPMAAVQVYAVANESGAVLAIGTHPDLVARCLDDEDHIDPISVCDFLNTGTPCCPYTMHRNVVELNGGTAYVFAIRPGPHVEQSQFTHWTPPAELKGADNEELAREFASRWRQAVTSRCSGNQLAVQLSGGLDSRMVIASVPADKSCQTLTLCDELNREARIASRVARCYNREWIPMRRDPEYVAQTALSATRLTGCEGEWHHAHSIGFADKIADMGVDSVFTGLYMDNNFKAYYAKDLVRVARMGGLAPAEYRLHPRDYIAQVNQFCKSHISEDLVNGCIERRKKFVSNHFANQRESVWEWLDGYPVTQASDNTGWIAERRVMPLRLPVMDRGMVDLAFQIPARLKAGGRLYLRAAALVLGPGARIPNANNGVRPGSGHFSSLLQRAVRKAETSGRTLLERSGVRLAVPHSWHDYQAYWRESDVLRGLISEHGTNLQSLEPGVFQSRSQELLNQPNLPWRVGLRLVQLALWQTILRQYRLKRAPAERHARGVVQARAA